MFFVFIRGFGTQSGLPVTVMEQSISAKSYRGVRGGGGGCEAEWEGETDPYPEERDSFHYSVLERERIRFKGGGEEGGGSFSYRTPE